MHEPLVPLPYSQPLPYSASPPYSTQSPYPNSGQSPVPETPEEKVVSDNAYAAAAVFGWERVNREILAARRAGGYHAARNAADQLAVAAGAEQMCLAGMQEGNRRSLSSRPEAPRSSSPSGSGMTVTWQSPYTSEEPPQRPGPIPYGRQREGRTPKLDKKYKCGGYGGRKQCPGCVCYLYT